MLISAYTSEIRVFVFTHKTVFAVVCLLINCSGKEINVIKRKKKNASLHRILLLDTQELRCLF
jgi:hypothetical protein